MLVYLTARDVSRGEAALEGLRADPALREAKALGEHGGATDVRFHQLNIMDSGSVQALVDDLKAAHSEGVDFVVNNAGIAMDGFSAFSKLSPLRRPPTSSPKTPFELRRPARRNSKG